MKILLATGSLLLGLSLTGCGGNDDPGTAASPPADFLDSQQPTAVITGTLLRADAERKNPRPAAGSVVLTGAQGARITDEVGADGTFELRVLPGEYAVTGTSPQPDGGVAACSAVSPTTSAAAGRTTRVAVYCLVQ